MATLTEQFNVSYPITSWTGNTTTAIWTPGVTVSTPPTPKPRAKTPLEWLDARVAEVCAAGAL